MSLSGIHISETMFFNEHKWFASRKLARTGSDARHMKGVMHDLQSRNSYLSRDQEIDSIPWLFLTAKYIEI